MPPSPSLRRSPKGDPHGDSHKRGRSFESGLSFKQKDDDLALFSEMQCRESENFLLESTDDFEDLLSSRKKSVSDIKLGITIPSRGESSDLLNADGDKNDYEWLLTPPDTPLFASLDDEPAPVNLVHNGRARSRPITLSRSSTMDRSHRSSRGSPSPQHLSPSPRSGTSAFQGKPSSAPQSNPVALRPSTPSRRPSPPPVKPSTPPSRSVTPTSRRTAAGSAGSAALSGLRGISPVRSSRGNSASPKIKAWQSNIPGFSLEAPPNLRTSLADRPAAYVRGSSPASRTSRDSSSKFGRQSMSPTPRSISSPHSQERDRLSSHSKGSLASSCEDDADSLQSIPVSVSDRLSSRTGVNGYPSGRPSAFSKKPTKTFSASSAPKRSFDSAIRQMDRRSPQNMFRPLLSSVPSSTFHSGKASLTARTMNSSVTTSSNASSDLATSGAHDTEGSDQYHEDMASACARATTSDIHDEVFAFDKMDTGSEDTRQGQVVSSVAQCDEPDKGCTFASYPTEESDCHAMSTDPLELQGDLEVVDNCGKTIVCIMCGSHYHVDNMAESEDDICWECKRLEFLRNSALLTRMETTQCASVPLVDPSEESHVSHTLLDMPQLENAMTDTRLRDVSETDLCQVDTPETQHHDSHPSHSRLDGYHSVSMEAAKVDVLSEQQEMGEHRNLNDTCNTTGGSMEMKHHDNTRLNIDIAEGAGISVLLNRSSSIKRPIVHGRTINSSAISFEDLSYARDLTSSMRSSVGHGSISTSSSVDFASARHGENLVRRQLSGKQLDSRSKPLGTVSSSFGISMPIYQGNGLSTSSHEGSIEGSVSNVWHIVAGERPASPSDSVLTLQNTEVHLVAPSDGRASISEALKNDNCMNSREKDPSLMSQDMLNIEVEDKSQASVGIDEGHGLHEINEARQIELTKNVVKSAVADSSLAEESTAPDSRLGQVEVPDDIPQCSLSTMSEIEINDSHPTSPRSQIDVVPRDELEDLSAAVHCNTDDKDLSPKSGESDDAVGIVEESTVTVEDQGARKTRSLTLEEATDTILFCSSIVHDLAYKAASIAIEKEKENLEPLERLRPTITIPDKPSSAKKDSQKNAASRTPKAKVRKTRAAESETKHHLTQTDERPSAPVLRNVGLPNDSDSMKPPKLESKCNCTIM